MKYTTGLPALDELFGGYYPRVIHMMYGATRAGKTTLSAYLPIARIAAHLKGKHRRKPLPKNSKFFVIDGDGGFDFDRASQVMRGQNLNPEEIFEHLEYWQPTTFQEQHETLTKEILAKAKTVKPLLIVADPIIAIYRGIVLRTSPRYKMVTIGTYTGKLDLQLITLRRMAVKHNCPVIISSWPGSGVGAAMGGGKGETPVIGGRAMGYLPKVILEMSLPIDTGVVRRAYLYKHRSMPEGRSCFFKLCDTGVEEVTLDDMSSLGLVADKLELEPAQEVLETKEEDEQ